MSTLSERQIKLAYNKLLLVWLILRHKFLDCHIGIFIFSGVCVNCEDKKLLKVTVSFE